MVKKKGQVTQSDTEAMFGDILDRIPSSQPEQAAPSPSPEAGTQTQSEEEKTVKVSLYLTPDEVNALDEQIILRRQQTGKSSRRSHLIREAIDLWLKKQG